MPNDRKDTEKKEREYEKKRDAYDNRWRSWLRGSSTGMDRYGKCIHPTDNSGSGHERGDD